MSFSLKFLYHHAYLIRCPPGLYFCSNYCVLHVCLLVNVQVSALCVWATLITNIFVK